MKVFRWDGDKNEWLRRHRGVCFEQVVLLMEQGEVLDRLEHHNPAKYPGQKIAVVNIGGYAYLVPYIEEYEYIILKTVIPSRKATAKYLGGRHEEDTT